MARDFVELVLVMRSNGIGRRRSASTAAMTAVLAAGALACSVATTTAQEPAPAFAAGGLSDWGASVNGKPGSAPSADGTTAAKPKTKPAVAGQAGAAGKAPPKKGDAASKAAVAPKFTPKFTPAGVMQPGIMHPRILQPGVVQQGPIVVRPPVARPAAAAAPAAAQAIAPAAAAAAGPKLAPGDCLAVNQIGPGTYQIENAGCSSAAVLATIEIRNGSRSVTCYIARIRDAYAVTSPPGAPPRINHQCRDGAPGCTEPALKSMFPECRGSV